MKLIKGQDKNTTETKKNKKTISSAMQAFRKQVFSCHEDDDENREKKWKERKTINEMTRKQRNL